MPPFVILEKKPQRVKYDLPLYGEIVEKKRMFNSKGYEYKLNINGEIK